MVTHILVTVILPKENSYKKENMEVKARQKSFFLVMSNSVSCVGQLMNYKMHAKLLHSNEDSEAIQQLS